MTFPEVHSSFIQHSAFAIQQYRYSLIVLLPQNSGPPSSLPAGRLLRIAVGGLACAAALYGAGRLVEYAVLGTDASATRARVEADTRAAFDGMARTLRTMAEPLGEAPAIQQASDGDAAASARLFEAAARALRMPTTATDAAASDLALTVYGPGGLPVAWSGRPSELTADRVQGPEAWFLTPGALGLRLVYLRPVIDGDGARAGSVTTEWSLTAPEGVRVSESERFHFSGSLVPVGISPQMAGMPSRPDDAVFSVQAPSDAPLLTAVITQEDLTFARRRWRRATLSLAIVMLGVSLLVLAAPLLDWRDRSHQLASYVSATLLIVAVVFGGRLVLRLASPADWTEAALFSATVYASAQARPLLGSPFDFLLTALAAGAVVALSFYAVEAWRFTMRRRRRGIATRSRVLSYLAMQLVAGVMLALLLTGYEAFLRDTFANTTLDLLHFSLHPWKAERLSLQVGLVVWHATTLALSVLLLRAAAIPWIVLRGRWLLRMAAFVCWLGPLAGWLAVRRFSDGDTVAPVIAAAGAVLLALVATRVKARYRHGSQAFRLIMLVVALVAPAIVFYPTIAGLARQAKVQLIETRFAPQAGQHRETVLTLLRESLAQLDAVPVLADMVRTNVAPTPGTTPTDRAFDVWRLTSLAQYPITSSVELHAPDGTLVSRFAFNLPEDLTATPRSSESTCDWDVYEEVSPFFAEERRILHAGRVLCEAGGSTAGSIVVHAMLDYANLPFISSQSPYVEFLREEETLRTEGVSGRDVEYAHYGWSRMPLFASEEPAWPLDDATFARAVESRDEFWTTLSRGPDRYHAYLFNDRGGIHALAFPMVSPLGHMVNASEITVLAALTYASLLGVSFVLGLFSRRGTTARALFREIRASFYRKLFIAFIAAAVVPVAALALLTRTYVRGNILDSIQSEAVRTVNSARRVVEDLAAPRAAEQGLGVDDNLMVWVSRLVGEDVNIFAGVQLMATSERNLFASGLLPTRTNAEVYRDTALRMQAATVVGERIGGIEYLVAGTPMSAARADTILTVPLASRQTEIEQEIDALDRRVLLAVLLFSIVGAGIGYWAAERIADPVNRLTRATRRIARGDLDARIAATSSDELRRLVEDFNAMASDLQRQRAELERTHRLEAWAEMARQVAHEIKNPLTPIQLNAEHLRRVHADRGEPLGPVLQECVATILQQVALLRQIASEFSSFASTPTAKRAPLRVDDLLREIIDPYRAGLSERITFDVDVPSSLPQVIADRTLLTRAVTNIIENAFHAMPRQGTLAVVARHEPSRGGDGSERVRIRVADTGIGMDQEALDRAFEPYFSTKVAGTGLGLPIAKRNVELNDGTIAIESARDRGTAVEITLPAAT